MRSSIILPALALALAAAVCNRSIARDEHQHEATTHDEHDTTARDKHHHEKGASAREEHQHEHEATAYDQHQHGQDATARDEHGHEHDSAAIYQPERGIQLSEIAREAVGLKTEAVTTRQDAGAADVAVIPKDALLRTVKGDFVYVANGEWFLRIPVTVGPFERGTYAATDGLRKGDSVVTAGVRMLWLAELQAINGGVGCADDN